MKVRKITSKLQGLTSRGGKVSWSWDSDLSIGGAASLCEAAKKICNDQSLKEIHICLPEGEGIPLPAFQILKAVEQSCEKNGQKLTIDGAAVPYGGRAW